VYRIDTDELYDLDDEAFEFLRGCASPEGRPSGNDDFIGYCLEEGILTTAKSRDRRPPLLKSPSPSLRYLELQITDRCNLRCRHCYIGKGHGSELTAEEVRTILGEFEEMQGLRVLITGGEPLLHSRFSAINKLLPDFSFRKVLFSNGSLLDEKTAKGLTVDEVQISIDGLQDAHDLLRGKGSFRAAIGAIRTCTDLGFDVSVSTMVHAGNLGDFDAMEDLFNSLSVKDWTVDVPCRAGRLESNSDLHVDPETGGRYLRYGRGDGLHSGTYGFACGLHLASVTAAGAIAKCTFYADRPVGAIKEGLRECWNRVHHIRLDELRCYCEYIEACRGGCRFRAETLEGPRGRDLYRCKMYDILKS